jgi:FkbM family methyltransferase
MQHELIQTVDKGFGTFIVIKNDIIGRCIEQNGFWENHVYNFYTRFLKDSDVVLDAGANVGFHTINMARKAKFVHAFEPQPLVYNLLCANVLLNDVTHKVEQYKLALGDKESVVKLQPLNMFDEQDGTHNFGGRGLTIDGRGEGGIKTIAFDSLNIDINVIKIDIQGFELMAVNGMLETLQVNKPWILLENYEGLENDEEVLSILSVLGYDVYRLQVAPREDCICIHKSNSDHLNLRACLDTELSEYYKKINNG